MVSKDEEAQLSFLLSGTCNVVPASYIKLRSYLNIHLSNIADQQNLNLPKWFRNRNTTCPYCFSKWSVETSSFKLLPSKKKKRIKNKKGINDDEIKESRNTLVLRCKVCRNKSLFSLIKKKPVKEIVKEETVKLSKKKKKKKDKNCGLLVKLKEGESSMQEVSKKEKRLENTKQNKNRNPDLPKKTDKPNDKNKKLLQNPFATQSQGKFPKKRDKKLHSLKQAIKKDKGLNSAKKTLKDFLTLI